MTAMQLKPGDCGIISGFKTETKSKARLVEMGLLPGTEFRIIKQAPFNGAVEVKVRDYYLSLRPEDAGNILVQKKG
jgi:Fe2+ transport system protein FeoA|tara:strand:+ start:229 stop:456 length:228 start_codon:yes stop_codon:yes gene_type:complete